RLYQRIIVFDFKRTPGTNRSDVLGYGIETKGMLLPDGDIEVTENFPGSAEVDDHGAIGNKKGNGDAALGRWLERICYDRWFATIGNIRGSGRIRTGGEFINSRKGNC